MKVLPANKPENILQRVRRARTLNVTCPASRHAQIIGQALLTKHGYPMLQEEPEHCAISLLSVVESLWKARAEIARLKGRADSATE